MNTFNYKKQFSLFAFAFFWVFILLGCGGGGEGGVDVPNPSAVTAPQITSQPQNQAVKIGETARFAVAASGTAPLTYQWLRDGQVVNGATASSFNLISALITDNSAKFSVRVSNQAGSVTSAEASLVVQAPLLSLLAGNINYENYRPSSTDAVDGVGATARFGGIGGMAADSSGNVYVAEPRTLRKVSPSGSVETIAGSSETWGYVDGKGTAARFKNLMGIAVDGSGNVYLSDESNGIRKVTTDGVVSTLVPASPGATAPLGVASPRGLAVDANGALFVIDIEGYERDAVWFIREISQSGSVRNVFGPKAVSNRGTLKYEWPRKIALDTSGNLFLAMTIESATFCIDRCNWVVNSSYVKKVSKDGIETILAGSTLAPVGAVDGLPESARFNFVSDLAVDASGNVFVADVLNHAVRKISSSGVTTVIGALPSNAESGQTTGMVTLGQLPGQLKWPNAIALDSKGSIYVTAGVWEYTLRTFLYGVAGVAILKADLP